MRITVTTYGDMTAVRALSLARLAAKDVQRLGISGCVFHTIGGEQVSLSTTKTGLSVNVQKFETEKAVEMGGEA